MGSMDAEVGREPQNDVFADEFLGHAQGGFYNAYYDRPACLGDSSPSGSGHAPEPSGPPQLTMA